MRLLSLLVLTFLIACCDLAPKRSIASSSTNEFMLVDNEVDALNIRSSLFLQEEKGIFASFHVWDGNKIGGMAIAELMAMANEGKRVRLILEGFGPIPWHDLYLVKSILKLMIDNNIEIRIWNPTSPKDPRTYLIESRQKRNHDKIFYMEGQEIVYEGDRNMQNINFRVQRTRGKSGHTYKSLDAVVKGDITKKTKAYLDTVWEYATIPDVSGVDEEEYKMMKKRYARYKEIVDDNKHKVSEDWRKHFIKILGDIDFVFQNPAGTISGEGKEKELLDLLKSAKSEIVMTSPFSRLPKEYLDVLEAKVKEGVNVVYYVGDVRKYGGNIGGYIYEPGQQEMLKRGIKVKRYMGDDFLHAKTIRVDQVRGYIGTHNFNMRSAFLDLESGFIFDDKLMATEIGKFTSSLDSKSIDVRRRNLTCGDFMMQLLFKIPKIGKQF